MSQISIAIISWFIFDRYILSGWLLLTPSPHTTPPNAHLRPTGGPSPPPRGSSCTPRPRTPPCATPTMVHPLPRAFAVREVTRRFQMAHVSLVVKNPHAKALVTVFAKLWKKTLLIPGSFFGVIMGNARKGANMLFPPKGFGYLGTLQPNDPPWNWNHHILHFKHFLSH